MKMLVFSRMHNHGQFLHFLYLVEFYYWVLVFSYWVWRFLLSFLLKRFCVILDVCLHDL